MYWGHFYLICFGIGFIFSLLSFLIGTVHLHWHLPHDIGHGHVVSHTHMGDAGHSAKAHGPSHQFLLFPLNPATIAAFLTWFGGIGYLLSRYSNVWFPISLVIAILSGFGGSSVIYFFLSRVLTSKNENMNAADYEMTGVLGKLSVPIREGGTGEIIYSQAGTRRTCGARSDNGSMIPKGSEVIVTGYEKGIAYVRLWSEIAGENEEMTTTKTVNSAEKETS
jgi:membrane protein implicated in regulation of membrane protease activity